MDDMRGRKRSPQYVYDGCKYGPCVLIHYGMRVSRTTHKIITSARVVWLAGLHRNVPNSTKLTFSYTIAFPDRWLFSGGEKSGGDHKANLSHVAAFTSSYRGITSRWGSSSQSYAKQPFNECVHFISYHSQISPRWCSEIPIWLFFEYLGENWVGKGNRDISKTKVMSAFQRNHPR